MSVVIETTLGDITIDLFLADRPRSCLNFLKLCKIKYYNYNLFHTISRGFIAQTGDPTGSRTGGESIFGILEGPEKRYFAGEKEPRIKHTKMGLISFVGDDDSMVGSQFFLTLGEDLTYLDPKHCVFGEVVEGFDILEMINETICDTDDRPYQDVRITHTVILDDPYSDPKKLIIPSRSPSPTAERLQGGRIAPDEEIDEMEGKTTEEVVEVQAEREAKARATILEMVGDIPDAEMAPPENVLFVCKLNPITTDDDLEIIFNRFGKIKSCEVIRDKKTGDSLQYAFIEFADQKSCEDAYFKMDNILIDDRRIHVDFSQSVSKIKWNGKGRGVTYYNPNDKFEEVDNSYSKQSRNKTRKDQDDGERKKHSYSDSSRTYKDSKKRGSDRPYFDRTERDKLNIRGYRRRSRSTSPKRTVSRQQRRSRSTEGRREKTRYERNDRYANDVYKRNSKKKYDSTDREDEKTKRKTAQIRRSTGRELERKNAGKTKLKEKNKKPDKKRYDTSSDFDSEIEKYKTNEKYPSKHKKERRKKTSSSETSDSSEKTYKEKSRKQNDPKKIERKKYYERSSDLSDSEDNVKKHLKKKSKSKRSKDYISDSDRDKRTKSGKKKRS